MDKDYELFGPEWEKEMMKHTKKHLISYVRAAWKRSLIEDGIVYPNPITTTDEGKGGDIPPECTACGSDSGYYCRACDAMWVDDRPLPSPTAEKGGKG